MKKLTYLLALILFAAIGCEGLNKDEVVHLDDEELQAFSDGLDADVGLSSSSINALNAALNKHGKDGKHRHDPGFLWKVAAEMQGKLSDEEKTRLFKWMDVQRWPILFIFGLIALVGVVNIISALAMVIIDKTRQIGLLKSLGITQGDLKKVFLIKGLIIGLSGALGGALLAILLAALQNTFKWIKVPEDVYFMDFIPVDVNGGDIGVIFLFSVATSILAAWWPTVRTNKIEPSSALKYE